MSRLYRVCALTLVALGAWLIAATAVGAVGTTVTTKLTPGSLNISPTTVQVSYHIPAGNTQRTVTSSFSATVTDATGAGAGWQIRAASAGAIGPQGQIPDTDHAIIDFNISYANGTPPNPTCVCDTISSSFGMILQTPPQTGVGQSTEVFTTQLKVPEGAPAGRYTATLVLNVAILGTVSPLPGVQPSGPSAPGGPVSPLPTARPASAGPSSPGIPNPLPVIRPGVLPSNASTNTTASQQTGSSAQVAKSATAVATTTTTATGNDSVAATVAPVTVGRVTEETTTPAPANPSASAVAPAATAPPNIATSPVVSSNNGVAPAGNSPIVAPATATTTFAAQWSFPVVTTIGNAVTFAPSLITGDQGVTGESVNWHLQTTYAAANHATISRVFGRDAREHPPVPMNTGKVYIVMTAAGLGQAAVAFDAPQGDSESAVIEPSVAVVTISIIAGP